MNRIGQFYSNLRRGLAYGFGKKEERRGRNEMVTQTRDGFGSPFDEMMSGYAVGQSAYKNYGLYDALKEIPVFDRAVDFYCKLIGDFEFKTEDDTVLDELNEFKRNVNVNFLQKGFNKFKMQFLDAYLSYGMGFGEMIPSMGMDGIVRLKIAPTKQMRFMKQDGQLVFGQLDKNGFTPIKIQNQDWIFYMAHRPENGSPVGNSLFKSLPFVSQVFIRGLSSLDNSFWRIADPSFIASLEGPSESSATDEELENWRADLLAGLKNIWQDRKQGMVRDMAVALAGGYKLVLRTLGADAKMFQMEVPFRVVLEEIACGLGIPPFLLGLSTPSSTYKLTTHQHDILLANINYFREDMNSVVHKIFDMHLIFRGYPAAVWEHHWNTVDLMDQVEKARAEYLWRQAQKAVVDNLEKLLMMGLVDPDMALDELVRNDIIDEEKLKVLGRPAVLKLVAENVKYFKAAQMLERVRASNNGH